MFYRTNVKNHIFFNNDVYNYQIRTNVKEIKWLKQFENLFVIFFFLENIVQLAMNES